MTTARDLITRALRDNSEIALDEVPTAAEASHGLAKLNEMMHALKAEGADTGWADIEIGAEVPLQPEHVRPVVKLLALELVPPERPVPVQLIAEAQGAKATLQAAFADIPTLKMDRGLRNRISDYGGDEGE